MTTEEMKRTPSCTDWKRVVSGKPDTTDTDAPDVSALLKAVVKQRGRPRKAVTKKAVAIRFSPEVLTGLKKTGNRWQTLANDVLREWLKERHLI